MSMNEIERQSLTEDDRFDLVITASGRAARNRPVWMFVLAGVFVLGSLLTAALAYASYTGGRADLLSAKRERARVGRQLETLESLRAEKGSEPRGVMDPLPTFVSTVEEVARVRGITQLPKPDIREPQAQSGVVKRMYTYRDVPGESIESLLGWVGDTLDRVPGLEVEQVRLTAAYNGEIPAGWTLTVIFRRLEKQA